MICVRTIRQNKRQSPWTLATSRPSLQKIKRKEQKNRQARTDGAHVALESTLSRQSLPSTAKLSLSGLNGTFECPNIQRLQVRAAGLWLINGFSMHINTDTQTTLYWKEILLLRAVHTRCFCMLSALFKKEKNSPFDFEWFWYWLCT